MSDFLSTSTARNVISFKRELNIKDSARVVTLLPGSRKSELKIMLPIFFETVNLLNAKFSDLTFVCPTPKLVAKYFRQYILENKVKIKHIDAEKMTDTEFEESKKSLFACSDLAIVTSGTAVLELAKASVPMVVGYRTGFITEILYRLFVKVHSANLVNLITDSKDVPEFLFKKCSAVNIFKEAQKLLESKEHAETQLIASNQAIRELGFGSLDPSVRAAKSIKTYLKL